MLLDVGFLSVLLNRMRCAYLGIVTPAGLEGFWPESEASRRRVRRATVTTRRRGVWAVLHHEHVSDLQTLVAAGERGPALRRLNAIAESLGSLP